MNCERTEGCCDCTGREGQQTFTHSLSLAVPVLTAAPPYGSDCAGWIKDHLKVNTCFHDSRCLWMTYDNGHGFITSWCFFLSGLSLRPQLASPDLNLFCPGCSFHWISWWRWFFMLFTALTIHLLLLTLTQAGGE